MLFRAGAETTRSVLALGESRAISLFGFPNVNEGTELLRTGEVVTVTADGGTSQVRLTAAASSGLEACNDAS